MVVTKTKESLYLVYQIDVQNQISFGDIDLTEVKKGGEGYLPHMLPMSKLHKKDMSWNTIST